MKAFVVDVNVAIVANGDSSQADIKCELFCVQELVRVRKNVTCLDDGDFILKEYRKYLSMSGQPGVGDEFMDWIYQNQHNAVVCERVPITPCKGDICDFCEIPRGELDSFDRSDRKYLAVALASTNSPEILNAVDSDWRDYATQLHNQGVRVTQLCPRCLR